MKGQCMSLIDPLRSKDSSEEGEEAVVNLSTLSLFPFSRCLDVERKSRPT